MEAIVYYYPHGHEAHFESGHPERPDRIEAIVRGIKEQDWWDRVPKLEPLPLDLELITSVHSPRYLEALQEACKWGRHLDADTYTTPHSWELALHTAMGACAVTREVWSGSSQYGFAFTRPPGHHATRERGMGFCLLNNVAIAAEYLRHHFQKLEGKPGADRVAIIDLDLHHGNGTQDIFWTRGDVLYISTHQSPLYPGSGRLDEVGSGEGLGKTVNLPLPPGTGDVGFQACMQEVILPLLTRFGAQILLISVGFDPHWRDPLGHLMLSAEGFRKLIVLLKDWATVHSQGKIALFLEGGYDLEAGAACVQAALAALFDQPWQDPLGPAPHAEGASWRGVLERALQLWHLTEQ